MAWSWKSLLQIPFARFLRLSFVDFWQFVPEVDFGSELSGGRQDVLPLHFLQEAANLNWKAEVLFLKFCSCISSFYVIFALLPFFSDTSTLFLDPPNTQTSMLFSSLVLKYMKGIPGYITSAVWSVLVCSVVSFHYSFLVFCSLFLAGFWGLELCIIFQIQHCDLLFMFCAYPGNISLWDWDMFSIFIWLISQQYYHCFNFLLK